MRYILLILLFLTALNSSVLTDKAYRAYKNRHYKKALELYKQATHSGSLLSQAKAEYNLGVFYLRGIGTVKSKQKALYHFRKSYLIGQGIPERLEKDYYPNSVIKVQRDTHRYLAKLESDPTRRAKHKKIATLLNNELKKREASLQKREELSVKTKQFLKQCQAARVIAPTERKDAEILHCSFYKRYPKRLKRYFHHRKAYRQAIDYNDREHYSDSGRERAYKAMVHDISPILRIYLKKEIKCMQKARTNRELFECEIDYLALLDTLLFQSNMININDAMVLYSTKEEKAKRAKYFKAKVDPKLRAQKIQTLQKKLATHAYASPI